MKYSTAKEQEVMFALKRLSPARNFQTPQGIDGKFKVNLVQLRTGAVVPEVVVFEPTIVPESGLRLIKDVEELDAEVITSIARRLSGLIAIAPRLLSAFNDPGMRADWAEEHTTEQTQDDGTEMHLSDETWGNDYNPIITGLREETDIAKLVVFIELINLEEVVESNIANEVAELQLNGFLHESNHTKVKQSIKLDKLYRKQDNGVDFMIPQYFETKTLHELLYKEVIDETKDTFRQFMEVYADKIGLAQKLKLKQFINTTSYWKAASLVYTSIMNWVDTFNTSNTITVELKDDVDKNKINEFKENLFETVKGAIIQMQDNERVWNNIAQSLVLNPVTQSRYEHLDKSITGLFRWTGLNEYKEKHQECVRCKNYITNLEIQTIDVRTGKRICQRCANK